SKERENIEYCKNIKEYLNQHSELYPNADVLADFFDNGSNEEDINLNNKKIVLTFLLIWYNAW
ncbi:hypothetical protein, partial [Lactobacillus helveticus]